MIARPCLYARFTKISDFRPTIPGTPSGWPICAGPWHHTIFEAVGSRSGSGSFGPEDRDIGVFDIPSQISPPEVSFRFRPSQTSIS